MLSLFFTLNATVGTELTKVGVFGNGALLDAGVPVNAEANSLDDVLKILKEALETPKALVSDPADAEQSRKVIQSIIQAINDLNTKSQRVAEL